jgi:V/A-type H+-transporting ATPase subunit C
MSATGSNPEYVNARVRARRAKLFSDEDYRKLVRMGPGEIARFMEETEYESEINALGSRHDGVDLIEYALNRNLAKHFDDLLRWPAGRCTTGSRATSGSSTPGT